MPVFITVAYEPLYLLPFHWYTLYNNIIYVTSAGDESDKPEDLNNNADEATKEKEAKVNKDNDFNKTPGASAPITGATPGAVQLMTAMDICKYYTLLKVSLLDCHSSQEWLILRAISK
jgi:hypothetical protein